MELVFQGREDPWNDLSTVFKYENSYYMDIYTFSEGIQGLGCDLLVNQQELQEDLFSSM